MGVLPFCYAGSGAPVCPGCREGRPHARHEGPDEHPVQFVGVHNTVARTLPTSPTAKDGPDATIVLAAVHGQDLVSANLRGRVHPAGWPYGVRAPVRAAVVGYIDPGRVARREPVRPGVALMSDAIGIFA